MKKDTKELAEFIDSLGKVEGWMGLFEIVKTASVVKSGNCKNRIKLEIILPPGVAEHEKGFLPKDEDWNVIPILVWVKGKEIKSND